MRKSPTRLAALLGQTAVSYGRFAVNLVVVAVTTPLMLQHLGGERFGLWVLTFSTLGFLGLLDLGLATGVVKLTAEGEGRPGADRRNRDLSTVTLVYCALGLLALLLLAIVAPRFHLWLDLPTELATTSRTLVWLIGIRSAVLLLPLSLFRGVLYGAQRVRAVNSVQLAASLAWGVSAWALLASGRGLIALAWANLLVMVCEHLLYAGLCYRSLPDLRLRPSLASAARLGPIANFSGYTFLAGIAGLVLLRTDPLIIQVSLTLSAVAVYAAALKIAESATHLIKQFTNLLAPMAARLQATDESDRLAPLMLHSVRWSLLGASGLALAIGLFAPELLSVWLGAELVAAAPLLRILLLALVASVPQLVASGLLTMTGDHRFTGRVALASAVANVALSLLLVRVFGAVGVALATLLCTLAFDLAIVTTRACRRFGLTWRQWTARVVRPNLICLLVAVPCGLAAKILLSPEGWIGVITALGLTTGAWLLTCASVCLDPAERAWVADGLGGLRRLLPGTRRMDIPSPTGDPA